VSENGVTRAAFVQAGLGIGLTKPGEAWNFFMRWWDGQFSGDKYPHQGPVPLESLKIFFERAEELGPDNMESRDGAHMAGYRTSHHERLRQMLQYYNAL